MAPGTGSVGDAAAAHGRALDCDITRMALTEQRMALEALLRHDRASRLPAGMLPTDEQASITALALRILAEAARGARDESARILAEAQRKTAELLGEQRTPAPATIPPLRPLRGGR